MLNEQKIKNDFPIFSKNRDLIFFDNASTTQKPKQVLETLQEFYTESNANVHRSIYKIAVDATEKYETARKKVAHFVNAKPEELIWTRGTTESINQVLYGWALWTLQSGDEIITTLMEHHSNIVPWQLLIKRGVKLNYVGLNSDGTLNMEELQKLLSKKTKLVTVTQMSNVLGTINDVEKISKLAHEVGARCLVDGAQSVPHMPVDVKKIGCDFLAFSGHKMLGPTGIGALYAKEEILEKTDPAWRGSEQIREVSLYNSTWNDLPWKFEPGTPNIADAVALGFAVDYLQNIGISKIASYEYELLQYTLKKLQEISSLKIFGPLNSPRGGIVSLQLGDVHAHDLASFLDEKNIAIRSGHHCAMPLMKFLNVLATARASFYIYNTKEEVDKFVDVLNEAKEVFKI